VVARGAYEDAGHQPDAAEHEYAQDSPLDFPESLVDKGDMARHAPGQDGQVLRAEVLVDAAHGALDRSAKGRIGWASRDEVRVWNEHRQLVGAFQGGAVYYCHERNACDLVLESAVSVARCSKVRKITWYIPDIIPYATGTDAAVLMPKKNVGDAFPTPT